MPHFHHFSMFNQIQSISNLVTFRLNTKAIALLFGQPWLIVVIFQCSLKLNQCQIWSCLRTLSRLLPKHGSFSSLFNVQSTSINFKFGQFKARYQGYSLTFWPTVAQFHHSSMVNQNQSISNLVSFKQNTEAIVLLFGHKWLIGITFQCSININQFQIWSCIGKIPRL